MNIETGKFYENKTWRFLAPCLRLYGEEFISKFSAPFKMAVGIHDSLLDGTDFVDERNIFILFDKSYQPTLFNIFYQWIKQQEYFVIDYCPDSELKNSKRVMIVIRFPDNYKHTYDYFLKGEYSKMLTKEEASLIYISDREKELKIVTKDISYKPDFLKILNKEFSTDFQEEDFIEDFQEFELPLKRVEEIFNCKQSNRIFFEKDFDKKLQTF